MEAKGRQNEPKGDQNIKRLCRKIMEKGHEQIVKSDSGPTISQTILEAIFLKLKKTENMKHHVFLQCNNMQIHYKGQGGCANLKCIKKQSNMRPKPVPKSMQNKC